MRHANVRYWHIADLKREAGHVGFRAQSRRAREALGCRLMTQSRHAVTRKPELIPTQDIIIDLIADAHVQSIHIV